MGLFTLLFGTKEERDREFGFKPGHYYDSIGSYREPRNNEACYHAKRRGDCPFYQNGNCRC